MTKLESRIATVRSFTRAFLVIALLAVLAYAALLATGLSAEVRGHILSGLEVLAGTAVAFYFTKNPEHVEPKDKEVTNETETQ